MPSNDVKWSPQQLAGIMRDPGCAQDERAFWLDWVKHRIQERPRDRDRKWLEEMHTQAVQKAGLA